ncbi:MAG: hypothetical protein VW405_01935 [Rhodospirillaceae bacterium]
MDRIDLDRIRARLEAAPPGPWTVEQLGSGWQLLGPTGTYTKTNGNGHAAAVNGGRPVTPYVLALPGGREFVEGARGDVEGLLAEVERLQGRFRQESGPNRPRG